MADSATVDRLEKDVSAVKNDVSALAGQITDALNTFTGNAKKQARRGYKQARATAEDTIGDLSERGSAMMDAAQDAATTIEETLEDAITQRPLATVGLAIGLGFLIGVTWRR
jgi:ElaB/YqjD/DUF883 family membrane-anchored ribosome-binding protein